MSLSHLLRYALLTTLVFMGMPAIAQTNAQIWDTTASSTKHLFAVTNQNQRIQIGTVNFKPAGHNIIQFDVNLELDRFKDFFLSMKEFKCLEGDEVSCHVPYPYRNPRIIQNGDLSWLEHSLLFLYKSPKDFGAKLWNGIYYHFEQENNRLIGRAQAIDLNDISAPPDSQEVAPYAAVTRPDYPAGTRWITQLVIE